MKNIQRMYAKEVSAIVMMVVLCVPTISFAQTSEDVVVETEPTTAEVITEPIAEQLESETGAPTEAIVEPAAELETPADAVQETAITQDVVESDVLEATANPEAQPSDDAEVIVLNDATSTEEVIEVIAEPTTPEEVVVEEAPIEEPVLDIVAESLSPEPAPELSPVDSPAPQVVEMKVDVDPEYVLSLSGKTIPTKKQGVIGASILAAPVATDIDAATGVMSVSGACASPYFVVLLFKNQMDYEVDPRSFILNRAYPCEGGAYDYSIDRLPPTLENGTYYLMVGEQGERGPWTPATGLTEITINRSN